MNSVSNRETMCVRENKRDNVCERIRERKCI